MSVVGIGTDIIEIQRLAKMSNAAFNKLAKRLLTPAEYQHFQQLKNPIPYIAKRWAGKEAAAKALGTGIAAGVSFQHIEIRTLASGQPELIFTEAALQQAQAIQGQHWHISLSDEAAYATAFVVISK
ncbi:holo-ACP synthase [Thalassotalea sp. G2M2-11]|uniref:holo-ACP synthase n=1 Tax=Thalassotalea sp. G2M2-11 TaxID=2787627 RepID=UPI0019D2E32C|nr:holo-ACP synthase [Thalassotalea sp. G2M2-11]